MKTTPQGFKNVCKIIRIVASIASVCLFVGTIIVAINAVWLAFVGDMSIQIGNTTVYAPISNTQNYSGFTLIYVQLQYLFAIVTMMIVSNFTKLIFKRLETSETPFTYDISDKITGMSIALMVGGAVSAVFRAIVDIMTEFKLLEFDSSALNIGLGGEVIFIGIILITLSYVFGYGAKLQQESDETL